MKSNRLSFFLITVIMLSLALTVSAQWNPTPNDSLVSNRISDDHKVLMQIYAPSAEKVMLSSSDMPDMGRGKEMTKSDNGVWSVTVGPMPAGSYRYNFNVDGVSVIDPKNPITSESNANTWSLLHINGAEYMDLQDVPHGAVAEVTYYSKTLEKYRRMHVYTPPGYESGKGEYPLFYLLHGAMDSDNSWSTVGRAGVIIDNLIAAGKAKPMVVVMPAGHTGPFRFGAGGLNMGEFVDDFNNEIVPLVEKNYRVLTDRKNRAIAGLSMGGAHTLDIGVPQLEKFAYIGVYSSGVFGIVGGFGGQEPVNSWEENNKAVLENAELKKGLELFWMSTGKDDFLIETSRATVKLLEKYGFDVDYKESNGGHTWDNWRDYLHEYAQLLFQ